jgi:hypothetical protein
MKVIKKVGWVLAGFIFCCGLFSCVGLQDRTMSIEEREEAEVVGSVTAEWTSTHFFHIATPNNLKNKAYSELKKVAQQRYPGNIDIKNISIAGTFSGWNILWGMLYFASPLVVDVQKITATGDVVSYSPTARTATSRSRTQGVSSGAEGATNRACETLIYELPEKTIIAVLSISSRDREIAVFVMDEIEYQLVDSRKFEMVDRKMLDTIRNEQSFQASGEVSDDSAISIGNMLGANIVITGTITGTEDTRRLTLKALDVKTAKIVVMVREQL